MLRCKIKPGKNICFQCCDTAKSCNEVPDCASCRKNDKEGILVNTVSTANCGIRAIVVVDGEINDVNASLLYDIRER